MKKDNQAKLLAYITREGIMKKKFAEKIGIAAPSLYSILNGIHLPSLEVAFKIEKITQRKVKAVDWLVDFEMDSGSE